MADLPDYYTQAQISEAEAAHFKGGLDANKSATPVSRDIYLATDTHILYVCFTDGTWTGFDAAILTQGILTLYADMAGGGFEIKSIKDPTAAQSAATRAYVLAGLALKLALAGGTMSGAIAMGGNKITGVGAPANAGDALIKGTRVTVAELPALTDEKIWKGTGGDVEEVAIPVPKSIVVSTYTGNNADDRQITTGFKCSRVTVMVQAHQSNIWMWDCISTGFCIQLALASQWAQDVLLHATNGFIVDANYANKSGVTYTYWAISE